MAPSLYEAQNGGKRERVLSQAQCPWVDKSAAAVHLTVVLAALNASALVVGHTPHLQLRGVTERCSGHVWCIDTAASRGTADGGSVPLVDNAAAGTKRWAAAGGPCTFPWTAIVVLTADPSTAAVVAAAAAMAATALRQGCPFTDRRRLGPCRVVLWPAKTAFGEC